MAIDDYTPSTVSALFEDLPVIVNETIFEEYTGKKLYDEIEADNTQQVIEWLDRAHECIYNCLIYKSGTKQLKDTIISNNLTTLEKPLKMAIIAQINYMLDAGGDFGTFAGSSTISGGSVEMKSKQELDDKIIAPKAINILKNARPDLLLGVKI